ncbi:hypothetical protein Pcinc_032117 [Petrolisthes cinctipes]|uniref:Uncharacterized protein n=1 Tax=Petrolisthes cinctipes TaxID=88211 RepID=A0AAE1EUR6_PETCI|nr:hypothetical protein Pcinc_032117 [Petrolisthes cinctipes]
MLRPPLTLPQHERLYTNDTKYHYDTIQHINCTFMTTPEAPTPHHLYLHDNTRSTTTSSPTVYLHENTISTTTSSPKHHHLITCTFMTTPEAPPPHHLYLHDNTRSTTTSSPTVYLHDNTCSSTKYVGGEEETCRIWNDDRK